MKADHETLEHIGDATAALALGVGRMTELVEAIRGLAVNSVLVTELAQLDDDGVLERTSSVPWASIAVWNHGTMAIAVQGGGRQGSPSGHGPAQVDIDAGAWACVPLAGTALTIYGRPGETVGIALFSRPQPPAGGSAGHAPWCPVELPAASGTLYTPPHGRRPILGGYDLRETTGGGPAVLRIRDGGAAGDVLATVSLAAGESTSDEGPGGRLGSGGSLYLEYVAGAGNVEGSVLVR